MERVEIKHDFVEEEVEQTARPWFTWVNCLSVSVF